MVHTVEHAIMISKEGVGLIVEGPLLGESMTTEDEVDKSSASLEVTAPIAVADEPSVLVAIHPWS